MNFPIRRDPIEQRDDVASGPLLDKAAMITGHREWHR